MIEEETITSEQINNLVEYGSIHSPEEVKKQEEENVQVTEETKASEDKQVMELKEKENEEVEKSFDDALKELTKHSQE